MTGLLLTVFLIGVFYAIVALGLPMCHVFTASGSLIPLTYCRGAASATDLTASNRCKSSGFGFGLLKRKTAISGFWGESELAPYGRFSGR